MSQVKPAFFSKNTSNMTPNMFPKSVQTDSKMEPNAVPERSPRHLRRKTAKNIKHQSKGFKVNQKAPQDEAKKDTKIIQNILGGLFFHIKNDDIYFCFFALGGTRPVKSSQNAIMVCKNEGRTFSRKTAFFSIKTNQT